MSADDKPQERAPAAFSGAIDPEPRGRAAPDPIVDPRGETIAPAASFDHSRREARVAKVTADAPSSSRGILARAFAGTASKRDAIRAMCLTCLDYDRQEIRDCTGYSCPLWAYRPYQKPDEPEGAA